MTPGVHGDQRMGRGRGQSPSSDTSLPSSGPLVGGDGTRSCPRRMRVLTLASQRVSWVEVVKGSGRWRSRWDRKVIAPKTNRSGLSAAHVGSRPGVVS